MGKKLEACFIFGMMEEGKSINVLSLCTPTDVSFYTADSISYHIEEHCHPPSLLYLQKSAMKNLDFALTIVTSSKSVIQLKYGLKS